MEEELQREVRELANLPTLPGVLRKVTSMVEDKKSSASDMADIISSDQVLSSKVLRLVNSPVYGFPGRISSITHAVVLLGFNVVKGLVLSTAVFDTMGKHGKGLWEHSLGCAVISRRIAKALNMPDSEEVMIAGLLHDIGKVALRYMRPRDYALAIECAKRDQVHVVLAEKEVFGVHHMRVASWLTEQWHFPARLAEPLQYHHTPGRANAGRDVTNVVHLADILARGMGYGFPGDNAMPPLDHEAYQSLRLSFDQIDQILEESEMEYKAGSDVFAAEGE